MKSDLPDTGYSTRQRHVDAFYDKDFETRSLQMFLSENLDFGPRPSKVARLNSPFANLKSDQSDHQSPTTIHHAGANTTEEDRNDAEHQGGYGR